MPVSLSPKVLTPGQVQPLPFPTLPYPMQKELVRHLPDTEFCRNASITVRPDTLAMTNHRESGFHIIACHSCWTGRQWLPIVNSDEAWTFEEAVEIARRFRKALEVGGEA